MNKSNNEIRNMSENWALDERNGYPYSGQSVQNFIKKTFGEKAGDFYYDTDTNKYLIFSDSDSRNTYLLDREENSDLLLGTFDAPASYTAEINISTPSSNVILSGTTGNYVDFTFDIKNKSGASTGDSVIATYTINNSGNIKKETRIYDAGTNVHFLVDEFISTGINNISIVVTGRNTLASSMAAVTFTVVNLELTSSFNFAKGVAKGVYLQVPYNLKGSNVKYIEWYVDGVAEQDVDTIIGLNVNATKDFDTSGLTVGKHNIQARAYITNNGTNYYSKTLYFDFVVKPESGTWETNTTYVLLGLLLDNPITTTLSVNVKQYQRFDYSVAILDSRSRSLPLSVVDNGTQIKNIAMPVEEVVSESYTPLTTGNHSITFTADGQTAALTVVGQQSDIDITEETDGLLLKLSAKGRSNNEVSPNSWTYTQSLAQGGNTISTTFTGFSWNAQSGWNNDALIIPAGSSINIGLNPLAGNPITKGRTIEIDFETVDIDNEQASILNLLNGTSGLSITASTAKLQTSGGTKVETKFRDGDRIRLSFIINRTDDSNNSRMLYIVNNGILERAARFGANDSIGITGDGITIGSAGCKIKLYSVSVYDKSLTVDQAFCNYAVNNPNIISIASFNDIYDEIGNIDVDKVNAHIPVMIVTGDISSIMSISDKSHKNDWNTNPVDIEFRNMQNPEMNFFIDSADIRLQGTSSISYPRKNFRIYSKSKSGKYSTKFYTPTHDEGDLVANGKYSFKQGSAPVTCWCLKADFAESSGSHNTGIARLWNSVMKNTISGNDHILRTNAQNWAETYNYPYDVRTTIDGFPIVLFLRDTTNSPLVCLGQYNFNNDKSTEDVYGFTALTDGEHTFNNSHVECWEVLDSDNSIALFTDVDDFDTDWDNAFEARYPDKNTNTTALKAVAQFVNSCYDSANDTVDVATWRAGKANHFDLNKLAAYYIYLLRFGAADQTVKNAMFTTEDGEHWFYINYDNDTILGIDNESRQFDTWDYGLFTQTPNGGYYYAGKGKSVLWRCFEADSECMALARQIDDLLFKAGLTYENVCQMFDDNQSGQWCERIYNENGRYKYISQALQGQNVLHMLQGSRKSHRHWYLQHRFEKYDNAFGNGTYSIRSIQARATGTVNIPQGAAYKFTPAINSSFGYAVASTVVDAPTERTAGTEYTATGLPLETGVGNLIYIYNANNIGAIDLSAYINALGSLNIGDAVDVNGNSRLTKLVLGDGTNTNAYLTAISGLSSVKSLEEIDIRGYQAITNMDLSALVNLTTLNASNSGLTSFAPASGVSITNAILPASIQSIILNEANVAAITYTPTTTLNKVELRNVTGSWNVKTFVMTWLNLLSDELLANAELTLTGINWTGMTTADVIKLLSVGIHNFSGTVTINTLTVLDYNAIVAIAGTSVFNADSAFFINSPTLSDFIISTDTIKSGGSASVSYIRVPTYDDATIVYEMYHGSTKVVPSNGIATYEGVSLDISTGQITSTSSAKTNAFAFRAAYTRNGETTYSTTKGLLVVEITYPTSVSISGVNTLVALGTNDYDYTKSFDTNNFNADIVSVTWSLSSESFTSIDSQDADGVTLSYNSVPSEATNVVLSCVVLFEGGVLRTGTKTISQSVVPITSFNITGPIINTIGSHTFSFGSFAPEVYNVGITSASASISPTVEGVSVTCTSSEVIISNNSVPDPVASTVLTVVATLANGNTITQTKTITIGLIYELETTFKSGTNRSTQLYNNYGYGLREHIVDILFDGTSIGTGRNYTFPDNNEHTVTFLTSLPIGIGNNVFAECSYLTSITIPNTVTSIGSSAFSNCSGITSITIPDSVTSIGSSAFYQCESLTSVTIGDGVTAIPYYGFYNCYSLTSIIIPSNVTSINNNAFQCCSGLTSITVSANNNTFDSRNNCNAIINTSTNTLFLGCKNSVIPNSVTSIGDYAFYLCKGITSITIPDSVTSIGDCAFSECSNVTSLTIGNSVASIGKYAFNKCSKITSITIPDSVTSIGDYAFSECSNVTSLTIGSNVTTIGGSAFYSCSKITSITIPDSVTTIGGSAFFGCSGLTSITIGSNVTTIGGSAFSNCSGLTSITVSANNNTFDSRNNCNAIINTSTNTLVSGCKNSVIPNGVTSIGSSAFSNCSGITSITIPNTVTSIGNSAFSSCNGLTSITIPDSVTSIGERAFFMCSSATSITIGNNVTTIGLYTFYNCSNVTSLTIGNSVTSIGSSAFSGCYRLVSITSLPVTAPTAYSGQSAFGSIGTWAPSDATKTLTVPANSTGYDEGYWKSGVVDKGYTLNKTL